MKPCPCTTCATNREQLRKAEETIDQFRRACHMNARVPPWASVIAARQQANAAQRALRECEHLNTDDSAPDGSERCIDGDAEN